MPEFHILKIFSQKSVHNISVIFALLKPMFIHYTNEEIVKTTQRNTMQQ